MWTWALGAVASGRRTSPRRCRSVFSGFKPHVTFLFKPMWRYLSAPNNLKHCIFMSSGGQQSVFRLQVQGKKMEKDYKETNKERKEKMWDSPVRRARSEGFHLVAMCLKTFLHVLDKGCHHQHYIPILVRPSTRAFHPSRVNEPTHDPNWPPPQRGCLLSQAEVFKFCLWKLSSPQGSFLPGWGIKSPQTNNKSSGFGSGHQVPRPYGGHIKPVSRLSCSS